MALLQRLCAILPLWLLLTLAMPVVQGHSFGSSDPARDSSSPPSFSADGETRFLSPVSNPVGVSAAQPPDGAPKAEPVSTVRTADGREAVPGRIVVAFNEGVELAERADVHSRARVPGVLTAQAAYGVGPDAEVVNIGGASSLDDAIRVYQADPRVRYAEPDYVIRAAETPNDPDFSMQWGMAKIQAAAAWNVTHGSPSVKVAILDCGIDEANPDLAGKVTLRIDFTGSPQGTTDLCGGHGTHVAGIAAANTNNGIGVAGVGYDSRLYNVKILDDKGEGTESTLAMGIRWAADNGAQVINASVGRQGACSQLEQDAIDYAWARNVVIVAAAGNVGSYEVASPASCNNVVAVGSTNTNDQLSWFSNYGSWVDVAAPGERIWSTVPGGGYEYRSGTSMATPHVSGLAALVRGAGWCTSNQDVVGRIKGAADKITGTGALWESGRINAAASVTAPTIAATPSHLALAPGQTGSITVTWTVDPCITGQVRISEDGGPESLQTSGPSGSAAVTGLTAPHTYFFRLYNSVNAALLASTTVTVTARTSSFSDVLPNDWAYNNIEQLFQRGITSGCYYNSTTGERRYCPDAAVTRAEMAAFILRALGDADPAHLPAYRGLFADVPSGAWYARYVEHLYDHGITAGCAAGPLRYCPDAAVTRAEMAAFVLRALNHADSAHLPAYRGLFADVLSGAWYARYVEHLYDHGITAGCATGPLRYCPDNNVTRREMAAFLARAFPQ
ncbi:MAG: hypothetical protein EPO21_10250 [Chloroflexota bacterium]|nr:MAG: hypothetical protein EPO21_10250 [Chloroflexota bacterium]